MALCVLQFVFLDAKYNGIVELQDALLVHKMLHSMPVMSHFLTSKEGKFIFQWKCWVLTQTASISDKLNKKSQLFMFRFPVCTS